MLNNMDIVKKISNLIPHDYKTAARKVDSEIFGINISKDWRYRSGGLERN